MLEDVQDEHLILRENNWAQRPAEKHVQFWAKEERRDSSLGELF